MFSRRSWLKGISPWKLRMTLDETRIGHRKMLKKPPDSNTNGPRLFSRGPFPMGSLNRIFVRDQGEAEDQTAGILMYGEDLGRGLNADIGQKDIFEIASNFFP